tara:strand:+ start:20 stop:790 length:771 start_codon:yes stop_codon:yes gene_type:complete
MIKKKDSNTEYHSHDSISASGLKTIYKKSVFHYLNKDKYVSTPAMNFGSAVHSVLLEPEKKEIMTLPKNLNLRTKKDREYKRQLTEDNKDKIIVSAEEKESLDQIIQNTMNNKLANKLLFTLDEIEHSYYGTYKDVPVRIRPDGIKKSRYIIDIKTCQDASPRAFRSSIYNYAYHLQACFYSEMLGYNDIHNQFRFIAIENKYPYDVAVYSLSDDLIEKGKQAWRLAFKSWQDYIINNKIQGFHWEHINEDGSHIL